MKNLLNQNFNIYTYTTHAQFFLYFLNIYLNKIKISFFINKFQYFKEIIKIIFFQKNTLNNINLTHQ